MKFSLRILFVNVVWFSAIGAVLLLPASAQGHGEQAQTDELHRVLHSQPLPDATDVAPGVVLVWIDDEAIGAAQTSDVTALSPLIQSANQTQTPSLFVAAVPVGEEQAIATALNADPRVRLAEPDYIFHTMRTPNDPLYERYQWNLRHIRANQAWDRTGTGVVTIAILDTGIDLTHPDLISKLEPGYDFVNNDNEPGDDFGHGTHVASIAAANSDNGVGVAGVAWTARIMPIKVLDANGSGKASQIAEGIRWAVDQGADLVNLSLGATQYSEVINEAVRYAYTNNVLVVAAAGNYYKKGNPVVYPAALNHVLAVAAVRDDDTHASYSSSGNYVDVAAPGGDPIGDNDSDTRHWIPGAYLRSAGASYAWLTGTSQAAPHVTGIAALLLAHKPSLTPDQLTSIITGSAIDVASSGWDEFTGSGRVDTAAALESLYKQAPPPTPTNLPPTPAPTPTPLPTPVAVDHTGDEMRVNSTIVNAQSDVSVVADESGNLSVIWRDGRSGEDALYSAHLYITSSRWGPNFSVAGNTQSATSQSLSPPAFISDAQNNLHAVWLTVDASGNGHLYYATQPAGTTEWQAIAWRETGSVPALEARPALTMSADGSLIAAWDTVESNSDSRPSNISWSRLPANSTQWSVPSPLVVNSSARQRHITLAGNLQEVHAAWVDYDGGVVSLKFASLDPVSWNWSVPVTVAPLNLAVSSHSPHMAVDAEGGVYLVWVDLWTNEQGDELFVTSRNAGQGLWSAPAQVRVDTGPAQQQNPRIVVAQSDIAAKIALVWNDDRYDSGDIFVAWATDTTSGWTVAQRINQDAIGPLQHHPDVTMDVYGNTTIAWGDYRTGSAGPEVYARFIPYRERYQIFLSRIETP